MKEYLVSSLATSLTLDRNFILEFSGVDRQEISSTDFLHLRRAQAHMQPSIDAAAKAASER